MSITVNAVNVAAPNVVNLTQTAATAAIQISAVPNCALGHFTNVQDSPAPETFNVCLEPGPSDPANAIKSSPAADHAFHLLLEDTRLSHRVC